VIRSLNSPVEAKPSIDSLWAALFPVLDQVRAVERAWNDLAPRATSAARRQVG